MTFPFAVLRMNLVCDTETSSLYLLRIVIGGLALDELGADFTLTAMMYRWVYRWLVDGIG
jgi:hypothetical protein